MDWIMKVRTKTGRRAKRQNGQTLAEVLITVVLVSMMLLSLHAGFCSGFATIQSAREDLRATQIMIEKMETIRLYTWDQINTPGFLPATFEVPYETGLLQATGYRAGQPVATCQVRTAGPAACLRPAGGSGMEDVVWRSGKLARQFTGRTGWNIPAGSLDDDPGVRPSRCEISVSVSGSSSARTSRIALSAP